jgi:hypothetical protein
VIERLSILGKAGGRGSLFILIEAHANHLHQSLRTVLALAAYHGEMIYRGWLRPGPIGVIYFWITGSDVGAFAQVKKLSASR